MKGTKTFLKATIMGGLITLLPLGVFLFVANWLWGWITGAIQPITDLYMKLPPHNEIVGDLCALASILLVCFVLGMLVKTRMGAASYRAFEDQVLRRAPGYLVIKETVGLFAGTTKRPFSQVALVRVFENATLMTAFVTDTHVDGSYTVFVPTGPNPMSGNIYHLKPEQVLIVDVSIEDAMRSIIGCGAGSVELLEATRG